MNMKRFTARTSREALALVREAFGHDAIVMSNKPCPEGVEVLAMGPESLKHIERMGAAATAIRGPVSPAAQPSAAPAFVAPASPRRLADRVEPSLDPRDVSMTQSAVAEDVERLQMSTLSFQDYVRDRMLRRRRAEQQAQAEAAVAPSPAAPLAMAPIEAARSRLVAQRQAALAAETPARTAAPATAAAAVDARARPLVSRPAAQASAPAVAPAVSLMALPILRDEITLGDSLLNPNAQPAQAATHDEQLEMLTELRSMRGLIEQRFGALAFMEKLQRQPRQAMLTQRLLEAGYSPALIRKLAEGLPADVDAMQWAQTVLERNLHTGERDAALEDTGGVYALVGATGVGKTTSTAKLAAAFATRHGAAHLGLITLDAYRVAAHEQLRTYGRILGVPVHTAHDRASLEDLLDLLSAKKMVLIDTAGMAQRDTRTRELLDMLSHRSIQRLMVVNSAAQGETIEDQLAAYAAPGCRGVILSKLDEAVKLGPALDSMIRHKLQVLTVANGQRVPEDWHRLSARALVQRSMKNASGAAWKLDGSDVSLIFAGLPAAAALGSLGARTQPRGLAGAAGQHLHV